MVTQCITPLTLYRQERNKNTGFRSDVVPCGKCPPCLKRRAGNWVFRLLQEQKVSHTSAFITLTYDDKNIATTKQGLQTLSVEHHQKFIKRLRKNITEDFLSEIQGPIKYYTAGEYGPETERPHFHSIIFNLPASYIKHPELITKDWQMGNVKAIVCNPRTIAYTTGYVNETLYTIKQEENDDRVKEFSLQSKGLGANYLTPARSRYYRKIKTPYLIIQDGQKKQMPRYYKNKIYNKTERLLLLQKSKDYMEENPAYTDEDNRRDLANNEILQFKRKNLKQRQQL